MTGHARWQPGPSIRLPVACGHLGCSLRKTHPWCWTLACGKAAGSDAADNCKKEWQLAVLRRTASHMVAVPTDEGVQGLATWCGGMVMELGRNLYPASFAPSCVPSTAAFAAQIDLLYARIATLYSRMCFLPCNTHVTHTTCMRT